MTRIFVWYDSLGPVQKLALRYFGFIGAALVAGAVIYFLE